MKRTLCLLIISFILAGFASPVYADRHHNRGHERERYGYNKPRRHKQKHRVPNVEPKRPKHRVPRYCPDPGYYRYGNARLNDMVNRAAYGATDVMVYQLDHDTYIVRYFIHGHHYMRQLNTLRNAMTSPRRIVFSNDGSFYVEGTQDRYYSPDGSRITVNLGHPYR